MTDYKIPCEVAHQIAVGLYRQVGEFVTAAKRDNPEDYERFKSEFLSKHAARSSATVKRRYTRTRSLISR